MCVDMPGQLKENYCNRKIAEAQSLNPHFPFHNRIDLSRTVKWCHWWSTVILFCAHTTMRTEIFTCLLIFAKRSSNAFWYLPLADLCTSADICPQILPYLLIFAKDLCMSGDMGPQIFAHLLVFACRSLHVCWYLPKDLRTSAHICPQQIFAHILIFAKLLCTFADICPQQIFARILIFAKVLRMSANICPQIFTCILIFAKVFCTSADICPQIFARLLIFAKRS